MRLSYPHKHITSEGCWLRHQWFGLGFCHDDNLVQVILISDNMGRQWQVGYVQIIALGQSGLCLLSILFSFVLLYFGLLISKILLTIVGYDTIRCPSGSVHPSGSDNPSNNNASYLYIILIIVNIRFQIHIPLKLPSGFQSFFFTL